MGVTPDLEYEAELKLLDIPTLVQECIDLLVRKSRPEQTNGHFSHCLRIVLRNGRTLVVSYKYSASNPILQEGQLSIAIGKKTETFNLFGGQLERPRTPFGLHHLSRAIGILRHLPDFKSDSRRVDQIRIRVQQIRTRVQQTALAV